MGEHMGLSDIGQTEDCSCEGSQVRSQAEMLGRQTCGASRPRLGKWVQPWGEPWTRKPFPENEIFITLALQTSLKILH